jgi:hypothetical protein
MQHFSLTDRSAALTFSLTETPDNPANAHEKEGTTMSESKTSQVRETARAAWKKMVDDGIARAELAYAEVGRLQDQALAQNRQAIDDMAKLSRDSVEYYGQLAAEWRKLTLEATRNAAQLFNVQG